MKKVITCLSLSNRIISQSTSTSYPLILPPLLKMTVDIRERQDKRNCFPILDRFTCNNLLSLDIHCTGLMTGDWSIGLTFRCLRVNSPFTRTECVGRGTVEPLLGHTPWPLKIGNLTRKTGHVWKINILYKVWHSWNSRLVDTITSLSLPGVTFYTTPNVLFVRQWRNYYSVWKIFSPIVQHYIRQYKINPSFHLNTNVPLVKHNKNDYGSTSIFRW